MARSRYAVELLLERRLWFFLLADAFFLLVSLIEALLEGAFPRQVYVQLCLIPVLALELPALCTLVAVERRAGCLDLALTVPSTQRYFVRRLAPVCVFLLLQSWIVLGLASNVGILLLLGAMVMIALVIALLASLCLFWALRLRTSGAVLVASLVSVAALAKWILFVPVPEPAPFTGYEDFYGVPLPLLSWAWNSLVLGLATVLFSLYAVSRLRRPESLLG